MGRITIHIHGLPKEQAYDMMLKNYQARLKSRNISVEYHAKKKSIQAYVSDIGKAGKLFLLDEQGMQYTSTEFADLVKGWSISDQDINLAIGPVDGWHDYSNLSDNQISLSKFTLPHELAAVVLTEQIYRATEIIKGTKYHRD
ncbi:MAG TPA: 23S rRNA (pseudouridine(1915)-N(3))-methyltransferase RlmH [Candidatus Poseidoniaceae archaeon]|nr:MAG TPA: hypothetical protein D7I07_05190 [Candidatus Poseidoniales archaeon]HII37876.1 23S rRNA (pseudouridine(1915)-N(3))-methyltransferase RlmH [Candidatus Poseidoniaceae archaeon]|tara:strand:- start:3916 stop:4344 length:429 start_codon:yes stop_codon:yes gene_type:complete